MKLPGYKKKQLFDELISPHLPVDLKNYIYVEPFGGTFAVASYLPEKPKLLVYNDHVTHDFDLEALPDVEYHVDYTEILKKYDKPDVIFYLDPPYVDKENWYKYPTGVYDFSHHRLFNAICEIKNAKVLISYEKNDGILKMYKDFKIFMYEGKRQNFRNEMLIVK